MEHEVLGPDSLNSNFISSSLLCGAYTTDDTVVHAFSGMCLSQIGFLPELHTCISELFILGL